MIKKISALVLALVLCLSVVVMPASAAGVDLGDATFAIALEWDKPSYKGGDTAILKLYADGADDLSFFTGAVTFGLSSDVFDSTVHTNAVLRAGSTTADWFATYYMPGSSAIATVNATNTTKIKNANTAAENELYDWYVKVGFAKNSQTGTHENTGTTYNGFYGTDFNPNEPFMTIAFTVKDDVPAGTAVRAAVTSGTYTAPSVAQPGTYIKTFKTPGEATTTANVPAASTDITKADTTVANGGTDVTIGAASIISPLSTQIRFNGPENGDTKAPFDVRTRATVSKADFAALLNTTVENVETVAKDKDDALRVGFVYMADSADGDYDEAAAKAAAIAGEDAPGYKVVNVSYIQRSGDNYVWTCFIAGPDYTDGVNALAYIICDGCEPQFKTVDATTFSELYDAAKAAGIIPKA